MKITIAVLVLLGLGGGGWYWYHVHNAGTGVVFRTAELASGEMVPTISATGTIEPRNSIDIGAQVAGQIIDFGNDAEGQPVDYRSKVTNKMVLAHIDPTLYIADLKSAEATLAAANAMADSADADQGLYKAQQENAANAWKRAQLLHPKEDVASEAMSENDYQTAKAAFKVANANVLLGDALKKQAQANVDQAVAQKVKAEKNLEYCTIYSTVDGVIIDRRVNIGQTVVSSLSAPSLFLIAVDLKQVQVLVSVNEADINKVFEGQHATFTVDAFPGETFEGVVGKVRLNAQMTQNVVTYTVEVNATNGDERLFPFMTANVQFEITHHTDSLLVPNAALRWYPQPEMVAPDVREAALSKAKAAPDPVVPAVKSKKADGRRHATSGPSSQPSTRPVIAEPHGHGTIWVTDGKFVHPVKVRTGYTDGVSTEITFTDNATALSAGAQLVVGEQRAQAADNGTTNPFAPKPSWGKKH